MLTPNRGPVRKAEHVIGSRPPTGGDWGGAEYANDGNNYTQHCNVF